MKATRGTFGLIAIIGLWGCTHAPDVAQDPLPNARNAVVSAENSSLAIWRSASSRADDRVRAVQDLIRVGASMQQAQDLLGAGGKVGVFHGPSVEFYEKDGKILSRDVGNHRDVVLEYPVSGGAIVLHFEGITEDPSASRFVGVGLQQTLKTEK